MFCSVYRERNPVTDSSGRLLLLLAAVSALCLLVPPVNFSVIAALTLAALVLTGTQAALYAVLRARREGVRFYIAMMDWRQILLTLIVFVPIGLLISTLWRAAPLALPCLLAPLAMMIHSLKGYTELLGEARATIEDMAMAVEKRDPCMAGHADRVSRLSRRVARELRMPEHEVEAVTTAGRLHDLGKISVPDGILLKTDGLDEDEFEEVKAHSTAGGMVVERCSLVQRRGDVAGLIRQHHERFDGRGYPDGLKGVEIKLGARVLAVAEAWDTMTTPRTWRTVLSPRQALDRLMAGRGTQFDPRVVNAFLNVVQCKEPR